MNNNAIVSIERKGIALDLEPNSLHPFSIGDILEILNKHEPKDKPRKFADIKDTVKSLVRKGIIEKSEVIDSLHKAKRGRGHIYVDSFSFTLAGAVILATHINAKTIKPILNELKMDCGWYKDQLEIANEEIKKLRAIKPVIKALPSKRDEGKISIPQFIETYKEQLPDISRDDVLRILVEQKMIKKVVQKKEVYVIANTKMGGKKGARPYRLDEQFLLEVFDLGSKNRVSNK